MLTWSASFQDVQATLPLPDPSVAALPGGAMNYNANVLPSAPLGSNSIDDLRQKIKPAPQERLARMVDLNEERSAHILRKLKISRAR